MNPTSAPKPPWPAPKPLLPPGPGILLPGASGDVDTGKIRRQLEVPERATEAPLTALEGAEAVARQAGRLDRADRLGEVVRRVASAHASLAGALAALSEFERAEKGKH
ncbi:MAG TPA: hypothetical protein VF954_05645 [Acidimicrobiales bacterium]